MGRLALWLPLVAAGSLTLGVAYGLLVWVLPSVKLNAILTCLLAFGCGTLAAAALKRAHIRSTAAAFGFGAVSGVLALYGAWVSWLFAVFAYTGVVLNPMGIVSLAGALSVDGVWSIGSSGEPLHGWPLQAIWLLEAAIVAGAPMVMALVAAHKDPYCESCRRWAADQEHVGPFTPISDVVRFRQRLEEGHFGVLGELGPSSLEAEAYSMIDLLRCPGCDGLHLMTVRTGYVRIRDGKRELVETKVVDRLRIDRESADLIHQLAAPEMPPEPAAAASSASRRSSRA